MTCGSQFTPVQATEQFCISFNFEKFQSDPREGEEMALSVKAYLNPDTNQQEIRRFAIDEGASANFAYLRQKIEQVFPSVRGKVFKLFWKGKTIGFLFV